MYLGSFKNIGRGAFLGLDEVDCRTGIGLSGNGVSVSSGCPYMLKVSRISGFLFSLVLARLLIEKVSG